MCICVRERQTVRLVIRREGSTEWKEKENIPTKVNTHTQISPVVGRAFCHWY